MAGRQARRPCAGRSGAASQGRNLGSEHADLAPSLVNLGDVLTAAVDFDRAIAVPSAPSGCASGRRPLARHPSICAGARRLGRALSSRRRHDDALKALRLSLRLKEQALAPNDVDVARTLENIALVLQRQGDYGESGLLLRRAAKFRKPPTSTIPPMRRL